MSYLQDLPHSLIDEYISDHEQKLSEILAALSDTNWTFQKRDKSFSLFFRTVEGSPFVQTKTVVSLSVPKEAMTYGRLYTLATTPQGPIPPQEIYAIYEPKDENQTIIYFMAMASPAFMVSPREFLLLRRTYVQNGKTIFMQMSIDNSDIKPERKDFVRGTIIGQAFVIENDPDVTSKSIMTVFSHVNPGGSLPVWAVNYSVKNQLDGVQYISDQAVLHWRKNHSEENFDGSVCSPD
jgi:hypothetical protein